MKVVIKSGAEDELKTLYEDRLQYIADTLLCLVATIPPEGEREIHVDIWNECSPLCCHIRDVEPYSIKLCFNVAGCVYNQCTYQAAHEMCHVFCHTNFNSYLIECIGEMSSMYFLERMGNE